ncbi:NAD(P)-dependent oxidoreductase [Orenia metallireducens]|uniref:NAD(P)-dependent oxidoreductase n=1 Tax=Orenia metallireducens TaxID=1413210 RepID=A0A1C0A761_9FIRM|nr:SDR family oxidoreductase [Orenia metallireducens]OCL26041.1 NAD(P)-dependent oxidoreductase [Orenia metallireducens]
MYPKYPYFGFEQRCKKRPITFPPQHQKQHPGIEKIMEPRPIFNNPDYQGSNKLLNKVAIITGGDSGIGRAVAVAFAKEGADIVIAYLYEDIDAKKTKEIVEKIGSTCLTIKGDLKNPRFSYKIVEKTIDTFGKVDILVNNAAIQVYQESILDITNRQLEDVFGTNIFSCFYMTKATLPHLKKGSKIINTTSVTAYEGHKNLIDYSVTKGAIVTFTRSLSLSLIENDIRVNAVAPGPIWTPFIPSSFPPEKVENFGLNTPIKRAGQPFELAPTYVYLASDDSKYVSGQVLHVNGGTMVSS